jgi:hypothetical protein
MMMRSAEGGENPSRRFSGEFYVRSPKARTTVIKNISISSSAGVPHQAAIKAFASPLSLPRS